MTKFLLTIYNNTDDIQKWMEMTPELQGAMMQEVAAKYIAYTQRLVDEGRYIASNALGHEGKVLHGKDDIEVTDGPYIFAKEMVGGFFYFTAENLEEATAIAKDCPALHFGARVEIREEMKYPG
ncbi:MAG: YciI family protein [Fimbriimonadaceae bacterium]